MLPPHIIFGFNLLIMKMKESRLERQRRKRRYRVHPITSGRMSRGVYSNLYIQLRAYPEKFFSYFRMEVATFDELFQRVAARLHRQDAVLCRSITPEERLMVTLRFLTTGDSFASLHFQFGLGKSTISYIVLDTCKALWDLLRGEFIPHPTMELWNDISKKFWEISQFPNCLGAVDGKLIRIQQPPRTHSQIYNCEKAIILTAIADAQYRFIAFDIGAYGMTNDSSVFKESAMGRRLYSQNFCFPEPKPLPGTDAPAMPFVLVGDETFEMCTNLVKPYSSRSKDSTKKYYNYRLSRAHQFVQGAFGILNAKWRIFNKPIQLKPQSVDEVIMACIVLHNFILSNEPAVVEEDSIASSSEVTKPSELRSTMKINRMRNRFADYFMSEAGSLKW